MKVQYFDLHNPCDFDEDITACIGYFDGLHLGHQKLIERVLSHAREDGSVPALITFEPDPWTIIKHMDNIPHLTTMEDRIAIGDRLGIQKWIILRFEEEMQSLSVDDFHQCVLKPLHLKTLICGFDFHYGFHGMGDLETLQSQSYFQVDVVDEVSSEHKKISSSRIEALLQEGDVAKAALFMGRYYAIHGFIKSGSKLGRKHGFPTANLQVKEQYIIPKNGVYAGSVHVDGLWYGAIFNIGHNPTYNYQRDTSIEAHLLDFNGDLYGREVIFRFCVFIRDEQAFSNADALSIQLHKDKQVAIDYIQERKGRVLCD